MKRIYKQYMITKFKFLRKYRPFTLLKVKTLFTFNDILDIILSEY
jgi:hypothetical protein